MSVIRVDMLRALDSGIFVDIVIKGVRTRATNAHAHTSATRLSLGLPECGWRGRNGSSEVGALRTHPTSQGGTNEVQGASNLL